MLKERTQQRLPSACATQRPPNGPSQLPDLFGDVVGQVGVFGPTPNLLDRIEIRRVRRQPFDLKPFGESRKQPSGARAVHRPAVDDQNHATSHAAHDVRSERFKVLVHDVMIVHCEMQGKPSASRRDCYRRGHRKAFPPVPAFMNGRVAFRGPGAAHHRLQHEAGFVFEDDVRPYPTGFFLYAANPPAASGLLPFRRAPAPGVQASGMSSPCAAVDATRRRGRILPRISAGSDKLPASGSTVHWRSHAALAHRATGAAGGGTVCWRVWALGRCAAWRPAPRLQPLRRPAAIGPLSRVQRPPSSPRRWGRGLHARGPLPGGDASPVVVVFRMVSYTSISEQPSNVLYLFNVQ